MAATATDRFVEIDGLKTRYRDYGNGPPVVLLHGAALGSSLDVWDRHQPALAAQALRTIAYDRPGYAGTDDPPDSSPAYQRSFVLKLMDKLELERPGLVGHSGMGGVVLQVGLEHPDRVSRIMVLGTGSLLPPLGDGPAPSPPAEDAGPSDREPNRDDVRGILESQLYNHDLITPELIETRYQAVMRHARSAAPAPATAPRPNAPAIPLWQRLGELQVPLLMMYGRDDRGSTAERLPLLRERYPRLDVRILDQCKHLVQLDGADAFIAAAAEFFTA